MTLPAQNPYKRAPEPKFSTVFMRKFWKKMKECKAMAATGQDVKRDKFRELAESRTNKALDAIGRIGNLSNRSVYEWDEGEVRKIIKALKDAVAEIEGRFASPRGKVSSKFKL